MKMKRTASIILLLTANIIMLAHYVVPHHHHNGIVVSLSDDYCEQHHHNSAEKCSLNDAYTRAESDSKLNNYHRQIIVIDLLFVVPNINFKKGFSNEKGIPFRLKPHFESTYISYLICSKGLRAPPVC